MSHIRQNVRTAAAAAVTGLATTGDRVFMSRTLPLRQGEFPCLAVYARSDVPDYEAAAFSGGVAYPVRTIELHVQGFVKELDDEDLEDTLDDIAEEVETALFATQPLATSMGMTLGEQTISVDEQGDETLGVIDMVFNVLYRTAEGAPGTAV